MNGFSGIAGRLAIVTGGIRGIGRAITDALVAQGAEVHAFDWEVAVAEDSLGFSVHKVDVSDAAAVNGAVAALPRAPTLLVNNAGITRDRSLGKMTDAEWQAVLNVNLSGPFHMLRAVSGGMKKAGYGRVVNIISINGLRGKFGQINYASTKAGLIGMTKTAAKELGRKGVTVNCVAPGMVMTQMAKALPPEILDKALAEAALGQLTEPEDVANAVLFLLSDAARMITGQIIQVDAGQYI